VTGAMDSMIKSEIAEILATGYLRLLTSRRPEAKIDDDTADTSASDGLYCLDEPCDQSDESCSHQRQPVN